MIGTGTNSAYGYYMVWNTTTVPGGTYTLQSLATDGAGNTTYSSPISITVDNTPPTTSVLVPSTGAILHGTSATLDASASASYGVGISSVQFVITGGSYNKSVIGTGTQQRLRVLPGCGTPPPFPGAPTPCRAWPLTEPGTPPTAHRSRSPWTTPRRPHRCWSQSTGAVLHGTASTLDASASASYGVGISSVQFVITGGSYNKSVIGTGTDSAYGYYLLWNTTTVPGGTYTLQSLATDGAGNTTYSSPISITVDNTPPTTAVTVPANGATVTESSSTTLQATASGAYGVGISSVQFVLTGGTYNQTVIGTATLSGSNWVYQWNSTGIPKGTYTLQSLATDAAGNTAYSPSISIKLKT